MSESPRPNQIKAQHLARQAVIYVRQSTPKQVEENTGSTEHQTSQKSVPLRWGWPEPAIQVIDQDLGLSGTSGDSREGWQRLLKLVSEGQVGIIVVSEISRLSRSRRDFYTLVDLCREFDVLLAVEGAIVQFDNPHDTFMANIRADVAEYDNELRRIAMMNGKLAKARRGHAVTAPPTGYVVSVKGHWVKEPDISVQHAIEEVFRLYSELGTIGRVVKFLAAHRLELPARKKDKQEPRSLHWVRPTRARIFEILRNPAFAGYYVFGRRVSVRGAPVDRRRYVDWQNCIAVPDHHAAYISPAEFHRIDEHLRRNRIAFGPPTGAGPALCQGLIRCGRCGRGMDTHYTHLVKGVGIDYVCGQARQQYGEPTCWSVNGNRLDAVVAAELFRSLTPPEVDAVVAAADEVNAGYEASRRQREAELERVRYEAELAEQRFKNVHPKNRLVAEGMEDHLELALAKVREVERKQRETPVTPPLEVTLETLHSLRSLVTDIPTLWASPSTTHLDKKQLVRLLVHEIRVVAKSEIDFEAEIGWVGGAATRHRIYRPRAGGIVARRLAAEGRTATEIAAELARLGITNRSGRPYPPKVLLKTTAGIEGTAGLPWLAYRETLRAPLVQLFQAGRSDAAIAAEFNRRGLRCCCHRETWTACKIERLRKTLSLHHPTGRRPLRERPPCPATPSG